MKGLLKKEYCMAKMQLKSWIAVYLFFVVFTIWTGTSSTLQIAPLIIGMNVSLIMFSYDHMYHWDSFVLSLPVSRKTVVTARYTAILLLALLLMVFSTVLLVVTLPFVKNFSVGELLPFWLGGGCMTVLPSMIAMPFAYKYGAEKARYVYMILFLVYGGLAIFFLSAGLLYFIMKAWSVLVWILALLTAASVPASWYCSVKCYEKAEF